MAQQQVDHYLEHLPNDWQRQNLQQFRALIHTTIPDVVEDFKWAVPVFLVNKKLLCAMSTFTEHTKYNFFMGAEIDDKHGLFNSGLESKRNRSINLRQGETIDQKQLADLLVQAAALLV